MSEVICLIGMKNTLYEQVKHSRNLEVRVSELLIRCLECWNTLIDLYSVWDGMSNSFNLLKTVR